VEPEAGFDESEVRELLSRLVSPRYADREAARRRLAELGEPLVPRLRAEAKRSEDNDARESLRRLVDRPDRRVPPPQGKELHRLRALEILERIGTPAARTVVERVSKGAPGFAVTNEAGAILRRWAK
jgi:hypothetical protein